MTRAYCSRLFEVQRSSPTTWRRTSPQSCRADVLNGANARIPDFAGGGLAGLSGNGGSGQPVTVINHFDINGAQLDAKQIIDEAEWRIWDGFTRESKLRSTHTACQMLFRGKREGTAGRGISEAVT